jgi:cellulose synthase/poly-beta-1,6-N-acetylglucosamine synthase-like glycosyltransferase
MKRLLYLAQRPEARIIAAAVSTYTLMLWLLPWAALALTALVLILTLALTTARLVCAAAQAPPPESTELLGEEFVSIHIATYSEPPEVVIKTLESLKSLSYPHYEVIVLDNNTPDPELYEPVRRHCQKLGSKFRFYHFDGVRGAKAGALNISLRLSYPRTEFILVLDADYQATADILQKGLAYFVDSTVGLVQFPQAYRNSSDDCGLSWEYKLFFDVYMKLANRLNTVLSTGTVAFVRRGPLEKSGGWSGDTLTEDAELGLRLHRHGYRGVYVPEVTAAGLMPTDLKSLRAQRRRWVLGNAQSLGGLIREEGISPARKLMMGLQLTAWASPLLLSFITLVTGALSYNLTGSRPAELVAAMGALSIVIYLALTLAFFLVSVRRNGGTAGTALRAYLVHLGMLWEASVCPCELFVQSDKSFVRTDKFIHAPETVALLATLGGSLLCGGLGFNVLLSGGCPWCAFLWAVFGAVLCGKAFLRWNLHVVRCRTVTLSEAEEAARPHPRTSRPASVQGRHDLVRVTS